MGGGLSPVALLGIQLLLLQGEPDGHDRADLSPPELRHYYHSIL